MLNKIGSIITGNVASKAIEVIGDKRNRNFLKVVFLVIMITIVLLIFGNSESPMVTQFIQALLTMLNSAGAS